MNDLYWLHNNVDSYVDDSKVYLSFTIDDIDQALWRQILSGLLSGVLRISWSFLTELNFSLLSATNEKSF